MHVSVCDTLTYVRVSLTLVRRGLDSDLSHHCFYMKQQQHQQPHRLKEQQAVVRISSEAVASKRAARFFLGEQASSLVRFLGSVRLCADNLFYFLRLLTHLVDQSQSVCLSVISPLKRFRFFRVAYNV